MDDRPLFEKPLDDLMPKAPRRENRELPLSNPDMPAEDLAAVARGQRRLIRLVAVGVLLRTALVAVMLAFGPEVFESQEGVVVLSVITGAAVILGVVTFVVFVLLVSRLYSTAGLILLLLLALTCVDLLAILIANVRATRTLRRNGVRVGFFGASRAVLERLDPDVRGRGKDAKLPKLGW